MNYTIRQSQINEIFLFSKPKITPGWITFYLHLLIELIRYKKYGRVAEKGTARF